MGIQKIEGESYPIDAAKQMSDLVAVVSAERDLPDEIFVFVDEPITRKRFCGNVSLDPTQLDHLSGQQGKITWIGQVDDDITVKEIVKDLVVSKPGVPLICDERTLQEFEQLVLIPDDERHSIACIPGDQGKILEIYTPASTRRYDLKIHEGIILLALLNFIQS